ncbi:hypothetical protein BDV37DRAFT_270391 [Aspergillus pseudonomiae]|uniref:Uncharacterized protein n=1 Tax=Aspergillus pseudonomiae TaxID=1506151 RepID=A0A5N7DHK4_9EURO|nr:uncharacterized protein BDV37DRAFT_270391 [Aspergillus pseudonomiae]KAE8405932.1 hypothetical protein BDV37DRAFT_270391 [Aspergillus pseudonomiae]
MFIKHILSTDSDAIILGLYGVFAIYHGLNRGRIYQPRHKVKDLLNSYLPHTRPAYQAGSIIQSNPIHYHNSMIPLHRFVYTHTLIFLLGTMGPTRSFTTNVNSQFVYAESVFGAALISIGHCHRS